jgi:hypothetical protein
MANNIQATTWRIDTAPFTYKYPVKVTNLNVGNSTNGDHVIVNDVQGNTLVDFTSNGADYRVGPLGWVNGIAVSSGNLGVSSVLTISVGGGK